MTSQEPADWVDLPDPIIAEYMDRVRALPRSAPTALSLPFGAALGCATFTELPKVLSDQVLLSINAWSMQRIALAGCSDPLVLDAYRRFWGELRSRGWFLTARAVVASGLFALRLRRRDPAEADRIYATSMARVVSRASIGWGSAAPPTTSATGAGEA